MTYSVITLGCKVNQYESQQICEMLESMGYTPSEDRRPADLYIINSCAVTATAEQKSRQAIHRARRTNPSAIICLSGCISQAFPDKYSGFTDADIVIGNSNREELPDLIAEFTQKQQRLDKILPHTPSSGLIGSVSGMGERTRAYLKIEDGCERFCAYCIIPYARGKVRSRSIDNIISEAKALAENYREIVLTGINLSAFGQDCGLTLADAVRAVASIDGIERIRLGSLEPDLLTEELMIQLASEPKFCPQFHMSLQSGCDATLARMNRHYDSAHYAALVAKIRERFDNPSITTDVMVGFPDESDEEFEQSLAFIKSIGFTRIHCFIYSPREGTVAAAMSGQIPQVIKNERAARLQQAAADSAMEFMRSQIGIISDVVAEREFQPGIWEGYTRNYTAIRFTGDCQRGDMCRVIADSADENTCKGHII